MKHVLKFAAFGLFLFTLPVFSQVPVATHIAILKAEDARDYERLKPFIFSKDLKVQARAILAAARIGAGSSVDALAGLLETGDMSIRPLAAFALGETEAEHSAVFIIRTLGDPRTTDAVRARAVEAAGKIAAANPKDNDFKALGTSILDVLNAEDGRGKNQNRETILLALTAALRARPEGADVVTAKFLTNPDAAIRTSAGNTMARLRGKNANATLRSMLASDTDPSARANAARALGAAEDKEALDLLIKAAIGDTDSRVRVSAIRSLASLKDAKAADKLLEHGEKLLVGYKSSNFANPLEKSELLEIASSLGRVLPNSNNARAIKFLSDLREADKYRSPETEIAFAQIAPKIYVNQKMFEIPADNGFMMGLLAAAGVAYYVEKHSVSIGNFAQGFATIAENKSADKDTIQKAQHYVSKLVVGLPIAMIFANPEALASMNDEDPRKGMAQSKIVRDARVQLEMDESKQRYEVLKKSLINGFPEILRAAAKLKTEEHERDIANLLLNEDVIVAPAKDGKRFAFTYESDDPGIRARELREREFYLVHKDPVVRATAAELVGEMKEINSVSALESAFDFATYSDKELNDAQLAILDAIAKQKGPTSKEVLAKALDSPDYLVRKKAAELIKDNDMQADFPNVDAKVGPLRTYDPKAGTKLGQILLSDADYKAAAERKNGSVKAVFTTEKGTFTIDLLPEDAPLTVDNFVKLANAKYFNGLEVHRVVANFVMQDGDPRGDGNGGPGWSIRCEMNMVPFDRGAVGMALSGKDTGGSQWFVTHAPQPHLDGGYTVFGRVNETGMKVVDNIVRGDKIITVRIIEAIKPPRR